MAREVVTVALVVDYGDEEACIEDILDVVCANSNTIQSFDILDARTIEEDDEE